MHAYFSFGLRIESEFRLPELMASAGGSADVVIRRCAIDWNPPQRGADSHFHIGRDLAYLSWAQVGSFAVHGGREIQVDPNPGVPEKLIRLPLLGTVLGTLLYQRGNLVLHAGAVSIEGGAVAFIGHKGCGKSTTVGALHARGHNVVTDDNLAVNLEAGPEPLVYPAFPQLKLWPDAAVSLGIDPERLPRIHDIVSKRSQELASGFEQSVIPLRCIYVLGIGPKLEIEPLSRSDAFIEVMRHTRCLTLSDDEQHASSLFPSHARLVREVPVRRLIRKISLADLPDVARAVEEDVAELTPVQQLVD